MTDKQIIIICFTIFMVPIVFIGGVSYLQEKEIEEAERILKEANKAINKEIKKIDNIYDQQIASITGVAKTEYKKQTEHQQKIQQEREYKKAKAEYVRFNYEGRYIDFKYKNYKVVISSICSEYKYDNNEYYGCIRSAKDMFTWLCRDYGNGSSTYKIRRAKKMYCDAASRRWKSERVLEANRERSMENCIDSIAWQKQHGREINTIPGSCQDSGIYIER